MKDGEAGSITSGRIRQDMSAAAKSHPSCSTLCDPTDGSPPGSSIPGILQVRTLEWVAISFSTGHVQLFSFPSNCNKMPSEMLCFFLISVYFWLCWVFTVTCRFSCSEQGLLFIVVCGFLIAVASPVLEHRLQAYELQQLWLADSRAQAQQLWHIGSVAPQHVESSQTED